MGRKYKLSKDDWREIFALRDDLDDEGRAVMRRLIKHCEHLEQTMRALAECLRQYMEDEGELHQ